MQEYLKKYLEIVYKGDFKVIEEKDTAINDKNLLNSIKSVRRNHQYYEQVTHIFRNRFLTGFSKHRIRDWNINWDNGNVLFDFKSHSLDKSQINEYCCLITMNDGNFGNGKLAINLDETILQTPIYSENQYFIIMTPKGVAPFNILSTGKSILVRKIVFVFENATDTNYFMETYSAMKMVYERKKKKIWWF